MSESTKDLQIKALVSEVNNLKKDFAIKLEEIQALYLENKNLRDIDDGHKKLNGELRKQIEELKLSKIKAVDEAKKESDDLMMNMINRYEKKIEQMVKDEKEMLLYP